MHIVNSRLITCAAWLSAAAAAGNTSAYIWAAWGYLEALTGNVARARKLFDAAIVVDETHAAAWHKWGMLEMRQGNYLRARCAVHYGGVELMWLAAMRGAGRNSSRKASSSCLRSMHPSWTTQQCSERW